MTLTFPFNQPIFHMYDNTDYRLTNVFGCKNLTIAACNFCMGWNLEGWKSFLMLDQL